MKFKKVLIIGPGLIGGSIGIFLRKRKIANEVVGVARHKKTLNNAIKKGAIDRGELDIKKAVVNADLIILCTPVKAFESLIIKMKAYIKPGCLIFDVGSTKSEVVKLAEKLLPLSVNFVGAHPMAGSEKTGVEHAKIDLYKNSICFITKTRKTKIKALNQVKDIWKKMGAKCLVIDCLTHDRIVAAISHVPHLISSVIVNSVDNGHLKFAATGFKDTTRIAASNAELWHDIIFSNKKLIIKQLDKFEAELKKIKMAIKNNNKNNTLIAQLNKAKNKRLSI